MRRAAKRDCNEQPIVDAFKAAGAEVQRLSDKGVPDLLIGFLGANHLVEVKWENAGLTADQVEWHKRWNGTGERVEVVRSPAHAKKLVRIWTMQFAERCSKEPNIEDDLARSGT